MIEKSRNLCPFYSALINNLRKYGAEIRAHRKKARLTQQQLAGEMKMSRVTISLIESGAIKEIGVRKLARLCARLGLVIQIVPRPAPLLSDLVHEQAGQRIEDLGQTSEILSGKKRKRKKP